MYLLQGRLQNLLFSLKFLRSLKRLKEFLRRNECYDINVNIGIMQYCMKCKAKIAIVTVQDILGLDNSARINMPGVNSIENWTWKLNDFNDFRERIKDFN
jgi:4-alpha-glucanotransferase